MSTDESGLDVIRLSTLDWWLGGMHGLERGLASAHSRQDLRRGAYVFGTDVIAWNDYNDEQMCLSARPSCRLDWYPFVTRFRNRANLDPRNVAMCCFPLCGKCFSAVGVQVELRHYGVLLDVC